MTPFDAANALGVVAFAVVGALKASDAEFDVLGVAVLGFVTALGGGMTRDVLVNRVPVALRSTGDVTFAALGVLVAILLARRLDEASLLDHAAVLVPDAIGLGAFAATGALVGYDAGVSAFGVVVLAALTGVGGGTISDVLLGRTPEILVADFYATCAIAGGVVAWAALAGGLPRQTATVAGAGVAVALRLLALYYDWHLPTV